MTVASASRFSVGITGHRPNRMHIGVARVTYRLEQVLSALHRGQRRSASVGRPVAVSALAEGSDRLFATAALALGYELHALLPFTSSDYETTFGDAAGLSDYRELLARAVRCNVLPGTLSDSTAAYEAVGRATVEASTVMITVWDGKPAAGRGGTPEIIEYALAKNVPVIWIDACRDRPPLLLKQPTASAARVIPLPVLAGRAERMTERQIMALAMR